MLMISTSDDATVGATQRSVPYWPLWASCFLGYAAIGMTIQVIPTYARERLAADAVVAGLAVTVGSLATMIARPIAGRLADQKGGRPIVMIGAALGCLGGLGHLAATSIPMLIAARLILGAGEGALFTAAIGWVLSDADPARRGKIAGHFGLSMWTGLAGGPILGAVLLAMSGYRAVWLAACFFPAIAWILLARTPRIARPAATAVDLHRALLPRAAWTPGISMAFASIGYGVVAAFLVPRFMSLGLPGREFALAVFGAAFLVTRFLGSPAVDRWGARSVLGATLIVEAIGLFGLFLATGTGPVFACTAVAGAGLSMLYPCLASLVTGEASAHERSAAVGAMTSAWDLGLALGGPIGGLVAGAANRAPFAVGAAAAIIAIVPLVVRPLRATAWMRRS